MPKIRDPRPASKDEFYDWGNEIGENDEYDSFQDWADAKWEWMEEEADWRDESGNPLNNWRAYIKKAWLAECKASAEGDGVIDCR